MTSVLKACLDYVAPLPAKEEEINWREQFVRNTVTEIALISLSTGLSCYFSISNELRWDFIKRGITVFCQNLVVRAGATTVRYKAISERGLFYRTMSLWTDCAASVSFARVLDPLCHFIHEGGHVVSAYLLFFQMSAIRVVSSLNQWETIFKYRGFWNYLGENHSLMLMTAAGPLATVVASQISLIGALILKDSYPGLSKNLFFHTLNSCKMEIRYAWLALDTNADPNEDYVLFWKDGGVHPYLAIIGMVAMPLISTVGFLVLRHRFSQKSDSSSVVE
jgi:hypothetical protein